MTSGAVYDEHVDMYLEFVDRVLASEPSLFGEMAGIITGLLGDSLTGASVLDVACGEGFLSRTLAANGAADVTGIDLSAALIEIANERSRTLNGVSFHVDDATELATIADRSVDIAVSQMALMDIADHDAMFASVHRVLRAGGRFVFSLLHPCFEGPFDPPDQNPVIVGEDGQPVARVVWNYTTERHWQPVGGGVRGHVGSYHRTLSSYLNALVRNGFRFDAMQEPAFAGMGLFSEVPRALIVSATALS